jgi:hypothetical protein
VVLDTFTENTADMHGSEAVCADLRDNDIFCHTLGSSCWQGSRKCHHHLLLEKVRKDLGGHYIVERSFITIPRAVPYCWRRKWGEGRSVVSEFGLDDDGPETRGRRNLFTVYEEIGVDRIDIVVSGMNNSHVLEQMINGGSSGLRSS